MPAGIFPLLFYALFAVALHSLLSSYERMFRVIIPLFALWIFVTLGRLVKIELRNNVDAQGAVKRL